MKLSSKVVPAVSVGSFVAIVAIGGVLLIQNGTRPGDTPIVDQHVAAVSSVTHTSSAAVAKPLAVVPRSSVVVKKPASIQGVTVTDPTSVTPAPSDSSADPASSDPPSYVLSSISNGAPSSMPPVPSVIRASSPPPAPTEVLPTKTS